jgi:hypothetical protein
MIRDTVISPATRVLAALLVILVTAGCRPEPVAPCGLDRTFQSICEIENPEDLVRLEGTPWVVIAQGRGGVVKAPVSTIHTGTLRLVAPAISLADLPAGGSMGDPACDGPPARARFRGIDAHTLGNGKYLFAGINGTEVQRVEFFEVTADADHVAMTWAGCVEVPRSYFLNDIAIGNDGAIYATHMYTRPEGLRRYVMQVHFLLGDLTGFAVTWRPNQGWTRIRNSSGSFPNGIVTDRAGTAIYMTSTYGSIISRIGVTDGVRKDMLLPVRPDNVSWSDRGSLIVAGGNGVRLVSTAGCLEFAKPGCAFPFGVVEIDADLVTRRVVLDHQALKIPGASSAILAGNALFLGSAAADRVTIVTP